MNRKYDIRSPKSGYTQMVSYILIMSLLLLVLQKDVLMSVVIVALLLLGILIQAIILLKRILRKNNVLELTEHTIKINQTELPIHKIEKIVIAGYFVQSIGIKLYGRKLVSSDLHFRFKNNEDINIAELKKWADMNMIKVTAGKIYRWI